MAAIFLNSETRRVRWISCVARPGFLSILRHSASNLVSLSARHTRRSAFTTRLSCISLPHAPAGGWVVGAVAAVGWGFQMSGVRRRRVFPAWWVGWEVGEGRAYRKAPRITNRCNKWKSPFVKTAFLPVVAFPGRPPNIEGRPPTSVWRH